LLREIWPQIHGALPLIQLFIAGAGAREALGALATQPGVRVMDFVEELNDFYSQVSLLCAPIRFGAGTRVKIVEAAAWQRAHVTTALGAEGLAFQPDQEIAIGNSAESLAGLCIELLKGDGAARLGSAARLRHRALYDRRKIVASLSARICRQLEDQ
jgi:glycosyltransferase involved in cell wall biosynthesis